MKILVSIVLIAFLLSAYVIIALVKEANIERERLARSCEVKPGYHVLGYYDDRGKPRCVERRGRHILLM